MKTNNKSRTDLDLNDAFPETELFLDFMDELDVSDPIEVRSRVRAVLEQYTLDEILEENDLEYEEVVGLLYETGYLGLPTIIEEDEDDEEVQNLSEED